MAQDTAAPTVPAGDWKRFISQFAFFREGPLPYGQAEFRRGLQTFEEDGVTPAVNFAGQTYYEHVPPGAICSLKIRPETAEGQAYAMGKLVAAGAILIGEALAQAGIVGQDPAALSYALALRGITVEGAIADGWYATMVDFLAGTIGAETVDIGGTDPRGA